MARIPNGIMGPYHGRVNQTIAWKSQGINWFRERKDPVQPNSVAQCTRRTIWATLDYLWTSALIPTKSYPWAPSPPTQTQWVSFMADNLRRMSSTFNLNQLKIASGKLEPPHIINSNYVSSNGRLTIINNPIILSNGAPSDGTYITVLYSDLTLLMEIYIENTIWASRTYTIQTGLIASNIHLYFFTYRPVLQPDICSWSIHLTPTAG